MKTLSPVALRAGLLAVPFLLAHTPALAADADVDYSQRGNGISFEIGIGAGVAPAYEGSDDYKVNPTGTGGPEFFKFNNLRFGGGSRLGMIYAPSFRFLDDREASDYPILTGIPDVDFSFELGGKLGYEWEAARVFATVRYGVVGHNSFTGELAADAIWEVDSQTTFTIGPRVSWGDQKYFDNYFSVPTTATNLTAYDASAGFKTAGVEAAIRHDFNDYWAVRAGVNWDRLIGDAADSPIVQAGSENQFSGKINLIRKFSFDF